MILPVLILLAAAAGAKGDAVAAHYDCTIDRQFVITPDAGGWNQSQVQFPDADKADWRFTIDLRAGAKAATATVGWDKDLVQIAGEHAVLRLAPGHYGFAVASGGPCMFTEEACLAMVEIADRDEGHASVLIAPAGLSRDQATGERSLLQVTSLGQCSRTERSPR